MHREEDNSTSCHKEGREVSVGQLVVTLGGVA